MNAQHDQAGALGAYRAAVSRTKFLTPEAERTLALRYRDGDARAGRALIEGCLSLVISIALEYRRWGVPLEDLVQEGNVGLLKALRRFDPDRGARLATYAVYWIRMEIREHVARGYRVAGLGRSKAERRALRLYRRTQERDPATLAAMSGITEGRARELLPLLVADNLSLDQPMREGDTPLGERLAAGESSPEDETSAAEEHEKLAGAVKKIVGELSAREQRIVERRLLADEPETLEQLGAAFGVTKERARQIEVVAKQRVRARLTEIASDLLPVTRAG